MTDLSALLDGPLLAKWSNFNHASNFGAVFGICVLARGAEILNRIFSVTERCDIPLYEVSEALYTYYEIAYKFLDAVGIHGCHQGRSLVAIWYSGKTRESNVQNFVAAGGDRLIDLSAEDHLAGERVAKTGWETS